MRFNTLLSAVTLAGAAFAAGCADSPSGPVSVPMAASAGQASLTSGTALFFNGVDANASTRLGHPITTQIDNMSVTTSVRFDGPNANNAYQMIYYNGHGAWSGWGIMLVGPSDGYAEGTVAILSGGITVAVTPLVLPQGKWTEIIATRTNGRFTVQLVGQQPYDLGVIPVSAVGGTFASIERTSVGGDGVFDAPSGNFHGSIRSLAVRSGTSVIQQWFLSGHGTTSISTSGKILYLGNATWTN